MLKRVSIQNFKSLKDVTLDLQKVNLLIGPNNSGKSNFLKALEYMSRYFQKIESVNNIKDDRAKNKATENFYQYYREEPKKVIFSKDENLTLSIHICTNLSSDYTYKWLLDPPFDAEEYLENFYSNNSNILRKEYSSQIASIFKNVVIYRPDSKTISLPGIIGMSEESINAEGSNIVNFLDIMLSKYRRKVFNEIEKSISICIPEFNEISLVNSYQDNDDKKNSNDHKILKLLGLTNHTQNITYWADELSEGTLYFLALLCIIHQPDPPKILLLEEPEKGIHPRRIWEIMRFIFQLAEEKDIQIILTTHNEHVINAFALIPESVFVFDKNEEGATEVKNLKRDIIDVSNKQSEENGIDPIDFTSDLGKSWLYGLIGGVPEENI